jgi:hypothetical protein
MSAPATNVTTQRARDWQPAFIETLRVVPNVSAACKAVGISRNAAYRARQEDEEFALAWHDAINVSLDELEAALMARAIKQDTQAAIFLLKAHRRDTYGDNLKLEHSGRLQHDLQALSVEELERLADGLAG